MTKTRVLASNRAAETGHQTVIVHSINRKPGRQRLGRKSAVWPASMVLLLALLVAAALRPSPVYAATINVDNGVVAYADDGQCSLPEAITNANINGQQFASPGECEAGAVGADTIVLPVDGLFTLTTDFVNYSGNTGLPVINSEIIIEGNGSVIERSGAAPGFRILAITTGGNLTINDTTVRGGSITFGGAVFNDGGTLTLDGSTLTGNSAFSNAGGAIYNSGTLNVFNSTLSGNSANDSGGAIAAVSGGNVTIVNSTLIGNSAVLGTGGGVAIASGTMTLINNVVSGNTAPAANEVSLLGGTINANASNVFGHNGESNAQAFFLFVPGASDLTATSDGTTPTALAAILDTTLADNGGPTPTHALIAGSPAIDFAPTAVCAAAPINGLDQRGEPRSIDIPGTGNDAGAALCDAGAYESQLAQLTITKATDPAGGTGFPFIIDPTNYSFDFTWGSNGIAVFQFREPTDIAFDSDGNVIVADLGNFRISKYQPDGTFITFWGLNGLPGSEEGMFNLAYGVAADDSGNIYVSDLNNHRVQKFDNNGNFLLMWGWGVDDGTAAFQTCTSGCQAGTSGNGAGQFNRPWGIGVDAAGNVFVSENGGERIQKFDGNGTLLTAWGSTGTAEGQFNDPGHLAVDPSGNVYVMDTGNNRVQKFDNNGNFLLMWGWGVDDGTVNFQTCTSGCQAGSFGSAPGQFFNALGIEVDAAGNVYVADSSNHRFQKFTADGEYLTSLGIGSPGNGNGEFDFPIGLGVNAEGKVYVADSFNDRIQVFTPDVSTILDDGQSESFALDPGVYRVNELVPDGWTLDNISCDGGAPTYSGATAEITMGDADITCTFSNSRPPSYCPIDNEDVGNEMTDLIGTGQGSPIKGLRTRKLVVPNSDEVVALYGQLAAVDVGVMKYVRFRYPDGTYEQIFAPTSPAYRTFAVDWWGADLDVGANFIKGQFFWGLKGSQSPRAFVLWPTYETEEQYANVFVTFNESSENHVAAQVGWFNEQTQVLSIPETQGDGATVVVRLAIVDNNKDTRPVWLSVTVGDQSQGNEDTAPNAKDTLNLYEFTFENVDAGVDEVTIRLESPPPGEVALLGGDSAAIIGAAVSYKCDIPVQ